MWESWDLSDQAFPTPQQEALKKVDQEEKREVEKKIHNFQLNFSPHLAPCFHIPNFLGKWPC